MGKLKPNFTKKLIYYLIPTPLRDLRDICHGNLKDLNRFLL